MRQQISLVLPILQVQSCLCASTHSAVKPGCHKWNWERSRKAPWLKHNRCLPSCRWEKSQLQNYSIGKDLLDRILQKWDSVQLGRKLSAFVAPKCKGSLRITNYLFLVITLPNIYTSISDPICNWFRNGQ